MLPVSESSCPLSDIPDVVRDVTPSLQPDVDVSSHNEKLHVCDVETGTGSSSDPVSGVPATAVVSCDMQAGTEISSDALSDVCATSVTSRNAEADTKTSSFTVSDVPTATIIASDKETGTTTDVVRSHDTEVGAKTSGYPVSEVPATTEVSNVPAATEMSNDVEAGSKSFCNTVTEVPSFSFTSHDPEAGTKVNGYQMNSVPAVTVTSHDAEASTTSSTMSDMPTALVLSQDPEAGTKTNVSNESSVPAAAVVSRDQEADVQCTSAGSPSPGRYVRRASAANITASPSKSTPQTNRRAFPRTNPAYIVRNNSVDGFTSERMSEVSPSASLTSTDTGLSAESVSQGRDLGPERSESSDFNPPATRHVRHRSEPYSVNVPVSDAVSMDFRATNEQSSDPTLLASAKPSLQHAAGSASMPSTPQYVNFQYSLLV